MNNRTRSHLTIAALALLLASSGASYAADKPAAQVAEPGKPTDVEVETWRQKIINTPQPKKGCFTASYPETAWREVPCSTEPMKVQIPRRGGGLRPAIVGNGTDFVAQVTGHIAAAEGSFENITGLTSETQTYMTTVEPNGYGLQLNSDYFTTTACASAPDTRCRGWEQFLVASYGGAGIQYWLQPWGPPGSTCPSPHHVNCMPGQSYSDGWCEFQFSPTDPVQCVVNGMGVQAIPSAMTPLDITNLHQLKLMGRAAGVGGSTTDAAIVTFGTTVSSAPGGNFFPDLGTQWQMAEFNIFGSCCGMQANFNAGTTMDVRLAVTSGSVDPPGCLVGGFTGETNNLTLVDLLGPVAHTGTPSLVFRQSNVTGSVQATCAGAVTIGDTHITTFDGVYYDFQASGDFLLADDGRDFVVQARQASGAPTWPNASVNKAVATRMGPTRVALYIEPTRLDIDGVATALADGATIARSTGVQISRAGNVYSISDERGNSVRATLNSTWIDVAVGLGLSPHTAVRGLLGNPGGNGRDLITAERVALRAPVLFRDLYHTYAESWLVPPKESLFTGETSIKFGIPTRPFYAIDLPPAKAARARAVCKTAGVKAPALLDSCTLDVAVLDDKAAAKVFVGAGPPRHVVKPVLREKQGRDSK